MIDIITVYGSYNHGSYLQAAALQKVLSKYDVTFLVDTKTREWDVLRTAYRRTKLFSKYVKPGRLFDILVYEIIEGIIVKGLWKKTNHKDTITAGCCVLGSDEIWNIKRKVCRYPVFWGAGIEAKKIAYAPSINTSTFEDFEANAEYIQYLNQIDCLSVRDYNSKNILDKYTDKDISVVLDPTLLLNPVEIPFTYKKDYIAVYSFIGQIDEEAQRKIREFAKENNLDLIATGQTVPWCDKTVHSKDGNPFYIYKNAKYVITSTFHGTAYAINYRKNFITFAENNTKITALVKQFGLENRIVSSAESVEKINFKPIDYGEVERQLEELRKKSFRYIEDAMKSTLN